MCIMLRHILINTIVTINNPHTSILSKFGEKKITITINFRLLKILEYKKQLQEIFRSSRKKIYSSFIVVKQLDNGII